MEPRIPCPEVFINEVGRHYPPCPSYETLQPIPMGLATTGVVVFVGVIGILLVLSLIAFTLTLSVSD